MKYGTTYRPEIPKRDASALKVEAQRSASVGAGNQVAGSYSSILGSSTNKIIYSYSSVLGGMANNVCNTYSSISGGANNTVCGTCAAILGGHSNIINNACNASIAGGGSNTVSGAYSSILGGFGNNIPATFQLAGVFGCDITAVASKTFHVNCLNACSTPVYATGLLHGSISYFPAPTGLGFPPGSCIAMIS